LGLHLRSFVTTTKTQPSLNHNLKSVPVVLTADSLVDLLDIGIYVTDNAGTILYSNKMGQELIAAGDTLYSAGGRLSARNPRVEKSIRNFFSSFRKLTAISNNDRLLLSVTDRNESVYVSHLLPLKLNLEYAFDDIGTPAADLFIRRAKLEMSLNVDVLSDAFRLTPAEVRVLTSIVNIGGTPEAAAAMGIAVTTVKTHLGRLFEKTGTTRQADLVKLVAACTMPLVE